MTPTVAAIAAALWAVTALAGDKKATGEFSATASIVKTFGLM